MTNTIWPELESIFPKLKRNQLKKLYNISPRVIEDSYRLIKSDALINKTSVKPTYKLSNILKIKNISGGQKFCSFAAVLLCGGKATRFGNTIKATFELPGINGFPKNPSLLMLNILQVIKLEKSLNMKIPIMIYCDFGTCQKIKIYLKKMDFFGKKPQDFYFIKQASGLRYIPTEKLLKINRQSNSLELNSIDSLPGETRVFRTENPEDSFIGTGHFIFNYLIASKEMKKLIRKYPCIKYLVISNVDNAGQKYFANLLVSENENNFALVCRRIKKEQMDIVYRNGNKVIIEPSFVHDIDTEYGFTGTCYIAIDSLLKRYRYISRKHYLASRLVTQLDCRYFLVSKKVKIDNQSFLTVHLETTLGEISRFLNLKLVRTSRKQTFYPFKSIYDVNQTYISKLKSAIKVYNYI